MNSKISIFIFTAFLYISTKALNCNNNPCDLNGYYVPERGYTCVQINTEAICTCPNGGFETDRPCRICDRSDPVNNPCVASPALIACLETADYGTEYVCLCSSPSGPVMTTSATCDLTVTLTSTPIATIRTTVTITPPICNNGGNLVDNICNCPSGFGGAVCELKFEPLLCERIACQNNGFCAIRNPAGPYVSVCLCRYGNSGEYCQQNGTLGFCAPGLCVNNAPCRETVIGATRFAYCDCPPGYNGVKCNNKYFTCTLKGKFDDTFMHNQGKYFECTQINGAYRLEQKSCPKGLLFNTNKNTCTI